MGSALQTVMIRLSKLVISCASVLVGCASGSEDSVTANTEQQQAISGPTIAAAGESTATPIDSLDGAAGIAIDGGSAQGSYVLVSYQYTGGAASGVEFTVTPSAGAAFLYMMTGSGGGYSSRQLRLQRLPGSDQLQAGTTSGYVDCGTVGSDRATTVTLVFDGPSHTFDVLIDGAATPCTGLTTKVSAPIAGFRMQDAANEGYGGHVEFTNLTVF